MQRVWRGFIAAVIGIGWWCQVAPAPVVHAVPSADLVERDLPAYLAQFPGPLATYKDDTQTAAGIIRSTADYYGVSVRVMVAVLEASNQLLYADAATVSPETLARPISDDPTLPVGFAGQIDWAAAQIRAGMGPYTQAPVVRFRDGLTATINLNQAPEGVAVQRMLAVGRTKAQWVAAVTRFVQTFTVLFDDQLIRPGTQPEPVVSGFLQRPWQVGVRVRHLSYFDHQFPTVDTNVPDDGVVVTYLGQNDVQYDGHDGHDYVFPDQLIGTPILAAADGLAFASTHRGNGVYIQHTDGYTTVYWHLDRFSKRFADLIDSGQGVVVRAGDVIGTSGKSGFVRGTPHLHFEVRRHGKQVDPYGWYGTGADPCMQYAACTTSTWLWSSELRGEFDFTPPNELVAAAEIPRYRMLISPRQDMHVFASFDDGLVPELVTTTPRVNGRIARVPGYHGEAMQLQDDASWEFATPVDMVDAGALSAWVDTRDVSRGVHYFFATTAVTDGLARQSPGIGFFYEVNDAQTGAWVLWCVDDNGNRDEVRVPFRTPGFHHVTAQWQRDAAQLQVLIDGHVVGQRSMVSLPTQLGSVTAIGRFAAGPVSRLVIDELTVWRGIPAQTTLHALTHSDDVPPIQTEVERDAPYVMVHLIPPPPTRDPVVQMRVLIDGHEVDPLPLTLRFAVALPTGLRADDERLSQITIELRTRAGAVQRLAGVITRTAVATHAVLRGYR